MLKKGSILFALFFAFQVSLAQTRTKKLDLKMGFGIKPTFLHETPASRYPLNFHAEYFFNSQVSGGVFIGFAQSAITYDLQHWYDLQNGYGYYQHYYDHYTWSFTLSGVRACYYFTEEEPGSKFEFYAGASAGLMRVHTDLQSMNIFGLKTPYHPAEYHNGYFCSVFAGARLKIDEHAGIFAELGYGVSYANAGIAYRF
jgi:hypothetical protein